MRLISREEINYKLDKMLSHRPKLITRDDLNREIDRMLLDEEAKTFCQKIKDKLMFVINKWRKK